MLYTVMITLEYHARNSQNRWDCVIQGPGGRIQMCDLMWVEDRRDLVEMYYWDAWSVIQGNYHCCLSVPGKVSLL